MTASVSSRRSMRALLDQQMINAIRAILKKEPLYEEGTSKDTEETRFFAFGRIGWLPAKATPTVSTT